MKSGCGYPGTTDDGLGFMNLSVLRGGLLMDGRRGLIVLLSAWALGIALLGGCGRTSPADFWSWSAQDSTKITALVNAWKDSMMSHFEEDTSLSDVITYIPDTTSKLLHKALRDNPYKQHWFPGTFFRRYDSLHTIVDSITETKDTTVTVTLLEEFVGKAWLRLDSATKYVRNETIGGIVYPVYSSRMMPRDSFMPDSFPQDSVRVAGTAISYLYLEPNDRVNRTEWRMKRMSGGKRYASPDDAGAPFLGALQLVSPGRRDTVVLRPDSLHYGMQRLYPRDSLLTFKAGDSITIILTNAALLGNYYYDPVDIIGFLHIPNPADPTRSIRRNIRTIPAGGTGNTAFTFAASQTGLQTIYVELMPRNVFSEHVENLSSRVWGIPVQVTP